MWHASGRGRTRSASRQICVYALHGVGDATLGQWEFDGEKPGVVHVQRRLSQDEQERFRVPEPYDVRGSDEERIRVGRCLLEMRMAGGR